MSEKRNFCIFCGGTGLNKEHVWPRWTHKYIQQPDSLTNDYLHIRKIPIGGMNVIVPREKRRQGSTVNTQLRLVCRGCNGGWMEGLERENREELKKLISGQEIDLDANQQLGLTKWLAKIYCVLEARNRNPADHVATSLDRTNVKSGSVPLNWHLWIGASTSKKWGAAYAHNAHCLLTVIPGEPIPKTNKNLSIFSFGIGHLFFHLRISPNDKYLYPRSSQPTIKRIWPPMLENINWPPGMMVNDDEIDTLHHELSEIFASLPHIPQ